MDYLWTPWRYQYISKSGEPGACVFCAAGHAQDDHHNLIVHRGKYNFVILNRFPYTSGHVMVVPFEHLATLAEAPDETAQELMSLARLVEKHVRTMYHPEGLNLGMNIGKSAGAGIAGHIHLHVLPRWTGDTNFMTTVAETRVLPEDLEVTWQKLKTAFDAA